MAITKNKTFWIIFWVCIGVVIIGSFYGIATSFNSKDTAAKATTQEGAYEDPPIQTRSTPTIEADMPTGFISNSHDSVNALAGWGKIGSPDWEAVQATAKDIILELNQMNYKGDADLEKDFGDIRELAENLTTNEDKGDLRELHRYFHDLDVVMNNADGDGAFYGITEWGDAND